MTGSIHRSLGSNAEPSALQQRWVKIITQFLIVSMIFILPEILMTTNHRHDAGIWRVYIKSALFIAIFFLNYYVIIDRCLTKPHGFLRLLLWNLIVIAVALVVIWLTVFPSMPPPAHRGPCLPEPPRSHWMKLLSISLRDAIMLLLTIGLSVAMKLSDYWMKMRQQKQEIEARRQHDELESLKRQLNPHFLFNTLNSIYALIAISPDKAQKAVHVLSRMLRYVLYENTPTVPLDDELNFIASYVELMRMRLDPGMPVNVSLRNDAPDLRIAPLIFISPVENAFKHGNTGMQDAFIDIDVTCRNGIVRAHFANRCSPAADTAAENTADRNHGIGDANLRRRLMLIYGDNASISTGVTDGIYTVDLTIDLKTSQLTSQ